MSCIVPNCTNSVGVPFPKDTNKKKLWLENLHLTISPTPDSFVCLDHFKPSDLNGGSDIDSEPSDRLKSGAVPSILKLAQNHGETDSTCVAQDEPKSCRMCDSENQLESTIHDPIEDDSLSIMLAITLCCHPMEISENDNFPKHICAPCLKQLRRSYKHRLTCLETDRTRRQRLSNETTKRKRKSEANCSKKFRPSESSDVEYTEIESDSENLPSVKSEHKECENDTSGEETNEQMCEDEIEDQVVEKVHKIKHKKKSKKNKHSPPLVTFDEPPPLVPLERKTPSSSITIKKYAEIERNLEEIHGVSKTEEKLQEAAKTKLQSKEKSPAKAQVVKSDANSKPQKIMKVPKGIRVTHLASFESRKGIFPCTLTHGPQESSFVMADSYLFTFGLLKSYIRFLHCVLPTCKANATQKLFENGTYENLIDVKIPHNHLPPSDQTRKKHVFFHVMRRRMHLDKTLNIRSIYEEVCNHEPEIRTLVPLRSVINEICRHQISNRMPSISTFEELYERIENEEFEKLHFTNSSKQFYQERFSADDGSLAVVFCNTDIISQVSDSNLMYVDSSFKIDTTEDFKYQLVTVLVWIDDSYYPILFALVNKKSQEIFKKVFKHLHDVLAPNLRPLEIVTDYEGSLYYALGETYLNSHIGGSVFYYTQNLYKKICSLNLSRDLETNSNFRNMYHMLLMLPLLPVNTILDALNNIEIQARDMGLTDLARPIFDHIRTQWILHVTPELFCVHRLENRINENVIAPFKKLRDFLLLFKGKVSQSQITVAQVVEKLIELEAYLHNVYTKDDKKSFGRDLSSFQKKNVVRAWHFIETHPKINVNNFFQKVIGYIKCMENQLWIWGFYRFTGDTDDVLINASNFSIVANDETEADVDNITEELTDDVQLEDNVLSDDTSRTLVMEAVINNEGGVVLQSNEEEDSKQFEKAFLKYVQYQ